MVAKAQIPYYAPTTGHGNLNGYTSLKFRPGVNAQETYTSFLLGLGDYATTGVDLYTCGKEVYSGLILRGGFMPSRYLGLVCRWRRRSAPTKICVFRSLPPDCF